MEILNHGTNVILDALANPTQLGETHSFETEYKAWIWILFRTE